MKKLIFMSIFLCLYFYEAGAQVQNREVPDSSFIGYDAVMKELSGSVMAPDSLDAAMHCHIRNNVKIKNQCYRIRIFFDNSRDARSVSSRMAEEFCTRYPDVPVYNQYANPYFKVTVGDFRSKSDAMKFMNTVKRDYPSAFLVKESYSAL